MKIRNTRRGLFTTLILLGLFNSSCEKKTTDDLPACMDQFGEFIPDIEPQDGQASFEVFDQVELEITNHDDWFSFEKVTGEKLVVKYEFIADDSPNIADDEYSEVIWFEVDPDQETFKIDADEFEEAKVIFGRLCYCADGGWHKVDSGCIYGQKLNNSTWDIAILIKLTTNYETYIRMIRKEFVVK